MADDANTTQGAEAQDQQQGQQGISPEEVSKLREQNQRLKGQLTDVEKKFQQFTSIYKDIDPDEVKKLRHEKEEAERKAAQADPAKLEELFHRKTQKVLEEKEAEKRALQEENARLAKSYKELAVTDRVLSKISKLFTDDSLKLVKRVVQERCDLDEDGTIVVKGEDGDVLYKGARPMTPEEFGEELVKEFPSLARPTGTPGGKDATPGEKRPGRFKVPETMAELQSMPNAQAIWAQLSLEDKRRLAKTQKFGA